MSDNDEAIANSQEAFAQGKTDMDVACADILEQIMRIKSDVNHLVQDAWHGTASETFDQVMGKYDKNSNLLNDALRDLSGLVVKAGGLHEDNEHTINSNAAAMDDNFTISL